MRSVTTPSPRHHDWAKAASLLLALHDVFGRTKRFYVKVDADTVVEPRLLLEFLGALHSQTIGERKTAHDVTAVAFGNIKGMHALPSRAAPLRRQSASAFMILQRPVQSTSSSVSSAGGSHQPALCRACDQVEPTDAGLSGGRSVQRAEAWCGRHDSQYQAVSTVVDRSSASAFRLAEETMRCATVGWDRTVLHAKRSSPPLGPVSTVKQEGRSVVTNTLCTKTTLIDCLGQSRECERNLVPVRRSSVRGRSCASCCRKHPCADAAGCIAHVYSEVDIARAGSVAPADDERRLH